MYLYTILLSVFYYTYLTNEIYRFLFAPFERLDKWLVNVYVLYAVPIFLVFSPDLSLEGKFCNFSS